MTIGQITISAADWMASKVSDRMELLAIAAQQTAAEPGAGAVTAASETGKGNTGNEHRDRERSILAAQENYKRVAARIKARLSAPEETESRTNAREIEDQTRKTVIASLEKSPSLAAALMADIPRAGPETKSSSPAGDTGKRSATEAANQVPVADELDRPPAEASAQTERSSDLKNDFEDLYPKGLWQDLFVDRNGSDATPDLKQ